VTIQPKKPQKGVVERFLSMLRFDSKGKIEGLGIDVDDLFLFVSKKLFGGVINIFYSQL